MQLTLLQSVHAPNRRWLQSFFAELQPDQRQVGLSWLGEVCLMLPRVHAACERWVHAQQASYQ